MAQPKENMPCCHNHAGKKILMIAMSLLAVALIVFLVFLIRNEYKKYHYIGKVEVRDTISFRGEGKVVAVPDIAQIYFGITKENKEVAIAQKEVNEKMDSFIEELKRMGIAKEDIQTTNYSINPVYDWIDGKNVLRGYEVNQQSEVKIRQAKMESIGKILTLSVDKGLNQVGGLSFTIDDPEVYRQQAREKALEKALEKAKLLSGMAKIKLGKIIYIDDSDSTPYYANYDKMYSGLGMGGGAESASIQPGSNEVSVIVTLTYEIL